MALLIFIQILAGSPQAQAVYRCEQAFAENPRKLTRPELILDLIESQSQKLDLKSVRADRFSAEKKQLILDWLGERLTEPKDKLSIMQVDSLVDYLYKQRSSSLAGRLRVYMKESFTEATMRRRVESEIFLMGMLKVLKENGQLQKPSVIQNWRLFLRNKGAYEVFSSAISNIMVLSKGTHILHPAMSMWLPRIPLMEWKPLPAELVKKTFEQGMDAVWPDFQKVYRDPYQAQRAWSAVRVVYIMTGAFFMLQYLEEHQELIRLFWRVYDLEPEAIKEAWVRSGWSEAVDVFIEGWKEAYRIVREAGATQAEIEAETKRMRARLDAK